MKTYRQILTFNGDNATSNDKQTTFLDKLPNSFNAINRVRCFNHTIQLSAKALLKPFDASPKDNDDLDKHSGNDDEDFEEGHEMVYEDPEDSANDDDNDNEEDSEEAEEVEAEDPLDVLDEQARGQLLEDTVAVRATLNKIRKLSFAIIHSTTIALPVWRKTCTAHKLAVRLIPRDVKTRWNSTYDMAKVALKYRPAIDDITANKSSKLRKYELDDDDWKIIGDLLRVLKVSLLS
ncbi:hypothetical protein M378DRAFT_79529 [Amanita muscaria Koide BX008]|uniref:Uncharacterized protein n=1 Tax=Amanita muscaria (strain Koide BX008) TaxID=946122 RepID=A0A0C2SK41_AMAMK|nr:hypothetical protein M378DRAFT_79529 [Amanita muscaria Koide BX008]